jgi:hypothetical protein
VLAASDGGFSVWRRGAGQLLVSPPAAAAIRAAVWSPTRAAVVFIGSADGHVEIWDFLESVARPAARVALSSAGITALSFRRGAAAGVEAAAAAAPGGSAAAARQVLAVGDSKGVLRLLDVSAALRRGAAGEEAAMAQLLDGEAARLVSLHERTAMYDVEVARREAAALAEERGAQLAVQQIGGNGEGWGEWKGGGGGGGGGWGGHSYRLPRSR